MSYFMLFLNSFQSVLVVSVLSSSSWKPSCSLISLDGCTTWSQHLPWSTPLLSLLSLLHFGGRSDSHCKRLADHECQWLLFQDNLYLDISNTSVHLLFFNWVCTYNLEYKWLSSSCCCNKLHWFNILYVWNGSS